ncbi:MAG TPA: argininosuccinate synthase domain-containing protein [Vicinamibacterales bacterium]|nr:argininosuccinate synthase domain-containing protein [Vicinamibacterales bacterium]
MTPIVLAYSGGVSSSMAVRWLADTYATDIVTVSLDVGQREDLGELRRRALSCGARRAHVVDVRDELARAAFTGPLLRGTLGDGGCPRIDQWPLPLIARALLEIARIEGARSVAHGSSDHALDAAIAAIDPSAAVLAPSRGIAPADRTSVGYRIDENLWGRLVSWPRGDEAPSIVRPAATTSTEHARLDIGVESGVPVSINGVPMSPAELVESLTLIAGRHGVGRFESSVDGRQVVCDAPAAVVLRTALAAAGESGVARLAVLNGTCALAPSHGSAFDFAQAGTDMPSSPRDPEVELVNQA